MKYPSVSAIYYSSTVAISGKPRALSYTVGLVTCDTGNHQVHI